MYGTTGGGQSGEFNEDVAAAILSSLAARTPKPAVIAFNEICFGQWDTIWQWLQHQRDYVAAGHWAKTYEDDCNVGGQFSGFGNVVVGLQSPSGAKGGSYAFEHQHPDEASGLWPEIRGTACLYELLGNATACSAHMTFRNSGGGTSIEAAEQDYAYLQLYDLSTIINHWAVQGVPMYILGDFNVETREREWPEYYLAVWWYQVFAEGMEPGATMDDRLWTYQPAYPFGWLNRTSIDYVFRRAPNAFTDAAYLFLGAYSDHRWYEAYLD